MNSYNPNMFLSAFQSDVFSALFSFIWVSEGADMYVLPSNCCIWKSGKWKGRPILSGATSNKRITLLEKNVTSGE
jgi:hypothetical protein